MLSSNDFLAGLVAKERREQLLEEARVHRLLAEKRAEQPSGRRLLARAGGVLVLIGGRLQARYDPAFERRLSLEQPCAGEM